MEERSNPLINPDVVINSMTRAAPWAEGHGASQTYLGCGLLYYTLTYLLRARLCVCIGSGGGFVPRLMRQAQRDLGIDGETHLVDANVPELGWGSPKWLNADSFFRKSFPDVVIHMTTSREAAGTVFANAQIDYLHIDADHSYEGCMSDLTAYSELLSDNSLVTLHDTSLHTINPRAGVHRVVEYVKRTATMEVLDLPFQGRGTAVLRPLRSKARPDDDRMKGAGVLPD